MIVIGAFSDGCLLLIFANLGIRAGIQHEEGKSEISPRNVLAIDSLEEHNSNNPSRASLSLGLPRHLALTALYIGSV